MPVPALAQHDHMAMSADTSTWSWRFDAQAFLNHNNQWRRFRDFHVVESQNWFMLDGGRKLGRGRLTVHGMFSLEPWTVRGYGSPQVFQTGETYTNAALVDYQHPHDLVMAASARFDWPLNAKWELHLGGGPVDSPALGPPVFMHRPSAEANPTAPLTHHMLDSTHITHGVITIGLSRGSFLVEGSAFHGREPDEDRVAIEFGPIDSYSGRLTWMRGRWQAQASAAHVKYPDKTEFSDHEMITASVSYAGEWLGRPLAFTGAYGRTREPGTGRVTPGALLEGVYHLTSRDLVYTRGELMTKDILTLGGYHPPGFTHPHILSSLGALTVGYERQILRSRIGQLGAGADGTVYYRDVNLFDGYGDPVTAHFFLRYRFR